MKNLLILLAGIVLSTHANAQLMRSEVYDFSVGDYFELEHKEDFGNVILYRDLFHILSKQLSVTSDTVVYVAQKQMLLVNMNPNGGPSFFIDTVTFQHTHLNSPFTPNFQHYTFGYVRNVFYENPTTECYVPYDSLMPSPLCISNSGQAACFGMIPYFNDGDTCLIEPFVSDFTAYSHAGGPYGGVIQGDPTFNAHIIDLGYVKHNGVSCGDFPSYFLATENDLIMELSVHPIPATSELTLSGLSSIASLNLVSSEGKDVTNSVTWNQLTVDVLQLPQGVYFLTVTDPAGKSGKVRVIK